MLRGKFRMCDHINIIIMQTNSDVLISTEDNSVLLTGASVLFAKIYGIFPPLHVGDILQFSAEEGRETSGTHTTMDNTSQ